MLIYEGIKLWEFHTYQVKVAGYKFNICASLTHLVQKLLASPAVWATWGATRAQRLSVRKIARMSAMSEYNNMSDRMPDTKCQIQNASWICICQNICQIEGQNDQKEFQIECQHIRQIDCHRLSVGGDRYVRSNSLLSHKHGELQLNQLCLEFSHFMIVM